MAFYRGSNGKLSVFQALLRKMVELFFKLHELV